MEKLYTLKEASRVLNVHQQTLRKWITQGKVPAVKLGKVLRVSPKELEHFIKERRTTTTEVEEGVEFVSSDLGKIKGSLRREDLYE